MATSNEIFDPNDLDSIDALLDEAELEAVADTESSMQAVDVSKPASASDMADPVKPAAASTTQEESLEQSDRATAARAVDADRIAFDIDEFDSPKISELPDVDVRESRVSSASVVDKKEALPDTDDFLAKRAAAQNNQNSKITADDMDSIKKLIIIFGSILIVLILTGIGIGVWSALAASSAGMDEETHTLIESIKVATDHNTDEAKSASETIKSVEKKLDALNFQLEQLATDLTPTAGASKKEAIIDPLGLGGHATPETQTHDSHGSTAQKGHVATVESHAVESHAAVQEVTKAVSTTSSDPAVLRKLSTVNANMVKAQRRIDEINGRVKKIQGQYDALLHGMKKVERQALVRQIKAESKPEPKVIKVVEPTSYKYVAPEGGDSYP